MRHPFALMLLCLLLPAGCVVMEPDIEELRNLDRELAALQADTGMPRSIETTWYVMSKGDTLYGLARRWDLSLASLLALNPDIIDLRAIPTGTRLRVPASIEEPAVDRHPEPDEPVVAPIDPSIDPNRPVTYGVGYRAPVDGDVLVPFGAKVDGALPSLSRGLDYAVRKDASVHATRGGKAIVSHNVPNYGTVVMVEHDQNIVSFYGNLSAVLVRTGQTVSQGEAIARAVGGKLHFRLTRAGRPFNPAPLLKPFK